MGKINRIQLRGISRTPSDRMNNDGGVAESLNMYIDEAESAPALAPVDVTSELGLPGDLVADKVFIHKTLHYSNVVYVSGNKIMFEGKEVFTVEGEVKDIASLGNVIIVATGTDLHYLLYSVSEKEYSVQGSAVPLPTLLVTSREYAEVTETYEFIKDYTTSQPDQSKMFGNDWNELDKEGKNANPYAANMATSIRNRFGSYSVADTAYTKPIIVRYALRLYNGTLITSVPYLVGGGYINGFKGITAQYEWDEVYDDNDNPRNEEKINVTLTKGSYRPYVKLLDITDEEIKAWKDIVRSIDVYVSDQMDLELSHVQVYNVQKSYDEATASIGMGTDEIVKNKILDLSLFYKVASYDLEKENEVTSLREGETLDAVSKSDDLVNNHDRLDPALDNMMPDTVISSQLSTYNASLLMSGVSTKVATGAKTMSATEGTNPDGRKWTVRYYIAGSNGKTDVLGRNEEGKAYFVNPKAYGWVVHPNVNCTKAVISSDGSEVVEVPMEKHPHLVCSYGYLGRFPLADYMHEELQEAEDNREAAEHVTLSQTNKIFMSEMENPYVFPIERRYTFESEVVNSAIASTALSQGQFGQFPLYVFTEDGIWAMETASDGSFLTSKPLSRDVCINPDSITSIDNAVVFVSDKGVMLLQGSQVVNISPAMNGKHYRIEESAKVIVNGQEGFKGLIPVVSDDTHFMAFVKEATIAYDYSGKRLIFIKKDEAYQYIYKLDANTWHKTAYGIDMVAPINSYPEALVQAEEDSLMKLLLYVEDAYRYDDQTFDLFYGEVEHLRILSEEQWREMFFGGKNIIVTVTEEQKEEIDDACEAAETRALVTLSCEDKGKVLSTRIYSLSTPLDVESQQPMKGVIITRPFDLDAPDVPKTIIDLRIRGQYTRGAVKYILLGSMDGVSFHVISTRRGKSWKLFRLVILADLKPTERISWIDIEYEERLNNRLR